MGLKYFEMNLKKFKNKIMLHTKTIMDLTSIETL